MSELTKEEQKLFEKYRKLLGKVIEREQEVQNLIKWLHDKTPWLTCPASRKYHCSHERGLLEHSIRVAAVALRLRQVLTPNISEESVTIVALFHDVGKIGGIGDDGKLTARYIQRDEGYGYNQDVIEVGLAVRSVLVVNKFVSLTDAEMQAILYHDGQYIPQGAFIAHRETPLTVLVHYADYWAGHVLEGAMDQNLGNKGKWNIK